MTIEVIISLIVLSVAAWWVLSQEEEEFDIEKRLLLGNYKAAIDRSRQRSHEAQQRHTGQKNTFFGRLLVMLDRNIHRAELDIPARTFLMLYGVLSMGTGFIISNLSVFPLFPAAILGAGLVGGVFYFYVRVVEGRRIQKFLVQFPDALDSITRGVRSGLPISKQIQVLGRDFSEPLAGIFRRVNDFMVLGDSLAEALRKVSQEFYLPEFQLFTVAVNIQQKTGGNLSTVLENIANTIRSRLESRSKLEASVSQAKSGAYIIGSAPLAMVLLLNLIQPDHFTPLFDTATGHNLLWLIAIFYGCTVLSFKYLLRDRF
ncbi:MAG: type II secretion system F family protein [Alphaproteobacteria bacterium GM7ARS4]|nr:type II secretion system F family protein [Alphaproteobacteria bacterium GM7ARS4]